MNTKKAFLSEQLKVLVVGNNPIELGRVFESLNDLHGKQVVTEIAFDLKSIIERLAKFKPNFILIDDNVGAIELNNSVKTLIRYRKTRSIPITVLKNSNYHEAISSGVLNYVLKANLTGESLFKALENSMKFRQTQQFLRESYRKRKGQLSRLIRQI